MAELKLHNSEKIVIIDDEDIDKVKHLNWSLHHNGYAYSHGRVLNGLRKYCLMHSLIMDKPKNMEIDHINGNKLDNRRNNLRIVTRSQNQLNRIKINSNNLSGYRGVHWDNTHNKWKAKINIDGKRINLGYWENIKDAATAYNNMAINRNGSLARLNEV